MKAAWMISIRFQGKRKNILFPRRENETVKDTYKRLKKYYIKLREKYPNYSIDIVSRLIAFPPKQKPKRGYIYCPYCMKDRKFYFDAYTGYNKCPVCNISDADFYVKKYNK